MNLAEALCGMDQTAHDNTCCYIETSKQHANRTMNLKFTVLDNAFAFSFFLFIWCLNPYDLLFDSGDWWWLFFYLGVPHLLWAYEAILLQWLKVNNSAEVGVMLNAQTKSERRWQVIRFAPKALLFGMAFVAAAFEHLLYTCRGIKDWCLEGDSKQIEDRLKTNKCSCADQYLISVGNLSLTRTTWPFLIYAGIVAGHVVVYFVLFASSARAISKQLSERTPERNVESKESKNIRLFIRRLTTIFIAVSLVFVGYILYPNVTMRSHIIFWTAWKAALLAMLVFMFRCVRTPSTRTSLWISTLFCCGEDTRTAVIENLDTSFHNISSSFSEMKTHISRLKTISQGESTPAEEDEIDTRHSGVVLEGKPSADDSDEDILSDENERRSTGVGSDIVSPLRKDDGTIEMQDIPLGSTEDNIHTGGT